VPGSRRRIRKGENGEGSRTKEKSCPSFGKKNGVKRRLGPDENKGGRRGAGIRGGASFGEENVVRLFIKENIPKGKGKSTQQRMRRRIPVKVREARKKFREDRRKLHPLRKRKVLTRKLSPFISLKAQKKGAQDSRKRGRRRFRKGKNLSFASKEKVFSKRHNLLEQWKGLRGGKTDPKRGEGRRRTNPTISLRDLWGGKTALRRK